MASFNAIENEIQNILAMAEEELTPEMEEACEKYLEELATAEADKIDAFAFILREREAKAKHYKAEATRLSKKAKSQENRINSLKYRYCEIMQSMGLKKIEGNSYTLSLRPAKSVSVTAMLDALPDEFVRVKEERSADKEAIKAALENGVIIDGCEIVTTHSLQIN